MSYAEDLIQMHQVLSCWCCHTGITLQLLSQTNHPRHKLNSLTDKLVIQSHVSDFIPFKNSSK